MRTTAGLAIVATLILTTAGYSAEEDHTLGQTIFSALWREGPVEDRRCGDLIRVDGHAYFSRMKETSIETIQLMSVFAAALLEPIFFADVGNKVRKDAFTSNVIKFPSPDNHRHFEASNHGLSFSDTGRVYEVTFENPFRYAPIIVIFTLSTIDPLTN